MTTKPKAKKFRIWRSSPLIETDHGAERAPSAEDYRAASQAHERQQAAAQPASTQQQAARPSGEYRAFPSGRGGRRY